MSAPAAKTKLKRKTKFSREEIEVMISTYEVHNKKLASKFGPDNTKAQKDHCWAQITNAVNAVGIGINRSVEDVKVKYKHYKKDCKAKVMVHRKKMAQTGNSSKPAQLDPLVERVAALIGETSLSGIPGGIEFGGESDDEDDPDSPSFLTSQPSTPIKRCSMSMPSAKPMPPAKFTPSMPLAESTRLTKSTLPAKSTLLAKSMPPAKSALKAKFVTSRSFVPLTSSQVGPPSKSMPYSATIPSNTSTSPTRLGPSATYTSSASYMHDIPDNFGTFGWGDDSQTSYMPVEVVTTSNSATQTAVTGSNNTAALLEQGERQTELMLRQVAATERLATAIERIERRWNISMPESESSSD